MLMTNDGPLSPTAGDDDAGPGLPPALSGRQLVSSWLMTPGSMS